MRLAIIGSRNFSRPDLVREFVRKLSLRDPTVIIISGGAKGVDTWAAEAARLNGLQVVEHLADWATHGRGAGFLRNTTLVEDSDKGVCFWDGSSHGSQDTANKFKKAGKPIEMIIVRTELA